MNSMELEKVGSMEGVVEVEGWVDGLDGFILVIVIVIGLLLYIYICMYIWSGIIKLNLNYI
jgi:hypothetical protein